MPPKPRLGNTAPQLIQHLNDGSPPTTRTSESVKKNGCPPNLPSLSRCSHSQPSTATARGHHRSTSANIRPSTPSSPTYPVSNPTSIEVAADGDFLTITGDRRDRLGAEGVPVRLERPTGKLRRSLRLPGDCDGTKIRTRFRDGVLEIAVPKGLSSRPAIRKEVITRATSPPVARRSDPGAAGRTRVARPRKTRPNAATRED
jgi:hypothetical protein